MAERTRKEGWGYMIHNSFKRPTNRAPDLKGDIVVNGVSRQLIGWWRVSAKGRKYLNIQLKPALVADDTPTPPAEGRIRTGWNAPTEEEARRVRQYDRVMAALLAKHITQQDIADELGQSVATISHLRSALTHYSWSRRQAAARLLEHIIQQANYGCGVPVQDNALDPDGLDPDGEIET